LLVIGKNLLKHNCLFEKAGYVFQKDNEQFEKRNRLTAKRRFLMTICYRANGNKQPSGRKNEPCKTKKAGVGAPAFTPIIN
jgi:hypothetical protein